MWALLLSKSHPCPPCLLSWASFHCCSASKGGVKVEFMVPTSFAFNIFHHHHHLLLYIEDILMFTHPARKDTWFSWPPSLTLLLQCCCNWLHFRKGGKGFSGMELNLVFYILKLYWYILIIYLLIILFWFYFLSNSII